MRLGDGSATGFTASVPPLATIRNPPSTRADVKAKIFMAREASLPTTYQGFREHRYEFKFDYSTLEKATPTFTNRNKVRGTFTNCKKATAARLSRWINSGLRIGAALPKA